jgi:nucleoside-diphosphate-sugar epimerase
MRYEAARPCPLCAAESQYIGDNPFIFPDCAAERELGWQPKLKIQETVVRAVRYLRDNPEIFESNA